MHRIVVTLLLAVLSCHATAQSPLTTDLVGNTGFSGTILAHCFDLEVRVPLTITSIDVSAYAIGGIDPRVRIWVRPGSYTGGGSGWQELSTGPLVPLGQGVPSQCEIAPFPLAPGNYGVTIEQIGVGVRSINGNGGSTPGSGTNQTYATAEMVLRGGALGTVNPSTTWCGRIHYVVDGSGDAATRAHYGTACEAAESMAFYERMDAANFDLANSAVTLQFTDAGYVARQGVTGFVPPTSAAVPLVFDANGAATVPLPRYLRVGRSRWTNALEVFRHGFVAASPGNHGIASAYEWDLDSAATTWWCHHYYNPSATAPGQVLYQLVGGTMYVTWDAVLDAWGQRSTFQFQFDTLTNDVHYVFGSMATGGGAYFVGFSEAGYVLDKVAVDISASLAATFAAGRFRTASLQLFATDRPVVGSTVGLQVRRIPATAPFGAVLVGLDRYVAGVPLGAIGLPTCKLYVSDDATVLFMPGGQSTFTHPLAIPPLLGVGVRAQAFVHAPSMQITPFGAYGSEGIDLVIGDR